MRCHPFGRVTDMKNRGMKELTLNVDPEVVEQAQRLARESGTSVSSLFERFVRLLAAKRSRPRRLGPITRQATGLCSIPPGQSARDVLAEALAEKYGIEK